MMASLSPQPIVEMPRLEFPSVDRWIRELDGQFSGHTLYEMIGEIVWSPVVTQGLSGQFKFRGGVRGMVADFTYIVEEGVYHRPRLGAQSILTLTLTETRNTATQLVCERRGGEFGIVLVKLFSLWADGARLPMSGHHPRHIKTFKDIIRLDNWQQAEAVAISSDSPIKIFGRGAIFLTLMGLELGVKFDPTPRLQRLNQPGLVFHTLVQGGLIAHYINCPT